MSRDSGSTASRVNAGPPVGMPTGSGGGKMFIGVPDDHVRTEQVPYEDPWNPQRRVAPGVTRGQVHTSTVGHRPQYNEAWMFAQFANMSAEDTWVYQQKMARAGLIGPKTRITQYVWDEASRKAFMKALELANVYAVDVDTALDMMLERGAGALGGDGEGLDGVEGPFSGTKSRTDKTVNLSNPQEARARLRSTLRSELGRAPRKEEMAAFIAALNSSEQANPVVDQSTATYVEGEVTGTNTTRSGGVDPGAFTEEHVRNDPQLGAERNSFTRDTDYYDAAMSVLGEGGGRL